MLFSGKLPCPKSDVSSLHFQAFDDCESAITMQWTKYWTFQDCNIFCVPRRPSLYLVSDDLGYCGSSRQALQGSLWEDSHDDVAPLRLSLQGTLDYLPDGQGVRLVPRQTLSSAPDPPPPLKNLPQQANLAQ